MSRRRPNPNQILSKAAAMENLVTWIVAASIARDPRSFSWFMKYAADRIPVGEKIKLLGEVVKSLPDPTAVYDDFLDDLRTINAVRVHVAHAIFIPPGTDADGAGYVKFRNGRPTRIADDELRAQVADAMNRAVKVAKAMQVIQKEAGLQFAPPPIR